MAIQQEVPGIDTYMVDARPEQATSSAVQSGWEAAEKLTPPTGDFPVEFKHSEELQVVKFLDPNGPFASYRQHFLTENYWAISRSGVKQSTVYHVVAIKERDLAEDYGIDPATAANAIASMEPFSYSTIKQTSYTDLLAIAEELMDR